MTAHLNLSAGRLIVRPVVEVVAAVWVAVPQPGDPQFVAVFGLGAQHARSLRHLSVCQVPAQYSPAVTLQSECTAGAARSLGGQVESSSLNQGTLVLSLWGNHAAGGPVGLMSVAVVGVQFASHFRRDWPCWTRRAHCQHATERLWWAGSRVTGCRELSVLRQSMIGRNGWFGDRVSNPSTTTSYARSGCTGGRRQGFRCGYRPRCRYRPSWIRFARGPWYSHDTSACRSSRSARCRPTAACLAFGGVALRVFGRPAPLRLRPRSNGRVR